MDCVIVARPTSSIVVSCACYYIFVVRPIRSLADPLYTLICWMEGWGGLFALFFGVILQFFTFGVGVSSQF